MFISALHQRVDFDRYLDQGTTVKLFIDEELDAVCENDEDVYLYYVKSGALEVGMNRDAERNTIFFIRSEGDAVICSRQGYLSFGTNRFTLRAVRNTVLVGFTFKQVKEFIRSDDDFLEDYLYEMHMAMAQMGHRIDTTAIIGELVIGWRGLQRWIVGRQTGDYPGWRYFVYRSAPQVTGNSFY